MTGNLLSIAALGISPDLYYTNPTLTLGRSASSHPRSRDCRCFTLVRVSHLDYRFLTCPETGKAWDPPIVIKANKKKFDRKSFKSSLGEIIFKLTHQFRLLNN